MLSYRHQTGSDKPRFLRLLPQIGILFLPILVNSAAHAESDALKMGIEQFRAGYEAWDAAQLIEAASTLESACGPDSAGPSGCYWLGVARFHVLLHRRSQAEGPLPDEEFEPLADAVHESLENALDIDAEDAESHAILGTLLGMEIAQGTRSGFWGGRALQKHHKLALQYGADNPRVQYLLGVSRIRANKGPEIEEEGLQALLKAELLFVEERGSERSDLLPDWGYDQTLLFIGETYRDRGMKDTARAYFNKALEVNPARERARRGLRSLEE